MNVLDLFNLSGQVAMVTGGARGLGRQMALALAEAGADVAICDLLAEDGQRTAAELAALGRRSCFGKVDVTRVDEIEAFIAKWWQQLGKIDILVNNAGHLLGRPGAGGGTRRRLAAHDRHQPVVHVLLRQTGGAPHDRPGRGRRHHQHGLDQLAGDQQHRPAPQRALLRGQGRRRPADRGMAADWAPYGIRANAIAPGTMLTAQTAASRKYPEIVERIIANTPMKRYGEEEEIKGLVVYLASPASSFMTGSLVVMDGGTTIW